MENLKGRDCYAGLDLSSTSDITALVLIFPPRHEGENYQVLPFFWLPEDTLALRSRRDHVLYDVWEKQGFLLTTEGNVVHYGFIERFIEKLSTIYHNGGHPVLKWMAQNVVMRQDPSGNIKPDKEKSVEKIDGIVATIMALDRCIRHQKNDGSIYDERGILSF